MDKNKELRILLKIRTDIYITEEKQRRLTKVKASTLKSTRLIMYTKDKRVLKKHKIQNEKGETTLCP